MNSLRANFENSAKLLPLSVSHSARKIVWPFRSTRNSIRIAATLCIPRNRGRPGQLRPNRTFSAPSLCLLIDFQRPVPRVPRLLNSTRVVAGPITFQLGADAVLGHGSALHWLSCSRGTIAGETSPRLPNANGYCDQSRTRVENHRQLRRSRPASDT